MDRDEMIATIADSISSVRPNDETEAACREALSIAMRKGHVLLKADEAREIARVASIPSSPVIPKQFDGFVLMTDLERDSLPPDSFVDIDGVPHVLCDGVPCRLTVIKDPHPMECADSIVTEQEELAKGMVGDDEEELAALHSLDIRCPYCGGYSLTQVWSEGETITLHCHDCDGDFVIEAPAPNESGCDELVPELGIMCEYEREDVTGFWDVTVFDDDGVLYEGKFVSREEMDSFLDGFVEAFDSIAPGVAVSSTSSPTMVVVDSVSGDEVSSHGKVASRSVIAASVASGQVVLASEPMRVKCVAGDVWSDGSRSVRVSNVSDGVVSYVEIGPDGRSSRTMDSDSFARMTSTGRFEYVI